MQRVRFRWFSVWGVALCLRALPCLAEATPLEPRARIIQFEAAVREDPALRPALAPQLVTLYADLGDEANALAWAHVVLQTHPAPKAYLAGVQSRLGHPDEANVLLREALHTARHAVQRVPLLWQRADVAIQLNDPAAARGYLTQAVREAGNAPMASTAAQRLAHFEARQAASRSADSATGIRP